jgi:hypothetical protein
MNQWKKAAIAVRKTSAETNRDFRKNSSIRKIV